jgi:hypothetical protein
MVAGGLSAKTIVNYAQVPNMVVGSVVTADGDQVYPRKWNHDFVGRSIIDPKKQHRPTVTEAAVGALIASAAYRFAVLFALLAGAGLRRARHLR